MNGLDLADAAKNMIDQVSSARDSAEHTPLFCALRYLDGWHVYSRTHQGTHRWCFIRTTPSPVPATHQDDIPWLDSALTAHADHVEILNSNHCTTPAGFSGQEVEVKLTLPATTSIWPLATDLHLRLTAGDILDMVPRFGVDFETCDYDNYLFEVTAPSHERGYVSFIARQLPTQREEVRHRLRPETDGDIQPNRPLHAYVGDVPFGGANCLHSDVSRTAS
jgi:hypothetical protein